MGLHTTVAGQKSHSSHESQSYLTFEAATFGRLTYGAGIDLRSVSATS
ncbi:unnamed protein product [Toxocara canis]|uniref:Porin n=1 Tax=Toxocara canis TaxID=6265 RepID=A0A183VAJ0_TOXCA|nr:unnamed protein product [Toxocara canis]